MNQVGINIEFVGTLVTASAKWSNIVTVVTGTNLLDMCANKIVLTKSIYIYE